MAIISHLIISSDGQKIRKRTGTKYSEDLMEKFVKFRCFFSVLALAGLGLFAKPAELTIGVC
jgi:hypothetical protein